MLEELKKQVYEANMLLPASGSIPAPILWAQNWAVL